MTTKLITLMAYPCKNIAAPTDICEAGQYRLYTVLIGWKA